MSRHMIRGRQLSRDTEHRRALRKNLVQSLFEHGRVRTTLPKAKEIKAFAEKLITLARQNTLASRRRVIAMMGDRRLVDQDQEFTGQKVVQKLFSEVAPSFSERSGGYTRIIKLPEHRVGDGGDLVLLQLLTEEAAPRGAARRSAGLRRKRNERRHQFAGRALKKFRGESAEPEKAPTGEAAAAPQPAEQSE